MSSLYLLKSILTALFEKVELSGIYFVSCTGNTTHDLGNVLHFVVHFISGHYHSFLPCLPLN